MKGTFEGEMMNLGPRAKTKPKKSPESNILGEKTGLIEIKKNRFGARKFG